MKNHTEKNRSPEPNLTYPLCGTFTENSNHVKDPPFNKHCNKADALAKGELLHTTHDKRHAEAQGQCFNLVFGQHTNRKAWLLNQIIMDYFDEIRKYRRNQLTYTPLKSAHYRGYIRTKHTHRLIKPFSSAKNQPLPTPTIPFPPPQQDVFHRLQGSETLKRSFLPVNSCGIFTNISLHSHVIRICKCASKRKIPGPPKA